ncbi:SDR family oxidoreductase [Microbacterium sp. NPDC028030]|uniref:SDR family oxidoreductase n=1 Tax=Microbacterium sp. NPDC028030 TaxID=3155124 RepID=UPI0033EA7C86
MSASPSSFLDRFSLRGRSVVVTGASGLYGSLFARALAEAGAHVVVTSREGGRAEHSADTLRADGLEASAMSLDLASAESTARFASAFLERFGAPDVLVNNAVHRAGGGLFETSVDDWESTSAVNSRGLFHVTQSLAKGMADRGSGSIINIGSIYGVVAPDFSIYEGTGMTMPAFYSFDKAGMVGFTRYLAAALGPLGVRANCICPGGLRSEGQDERFVDAYERRVPLRRLADEDDVTGTLVYLASDAASYVTGAVIPVDGGWSSM